MISTKFTIREQNEISVLNEVIHAKEISRATLAQKTGLTKASISSITKKLLEDNLIVESRIGDSSSLGGRKPIILSFNGEAALVIGLDIGYNYIEGTMSYIDGKTVSSVSKKEIRINSNNVIGEITSIIDHFIELQPLSTHGIVGIAAGIHGVVIDNKISFTPHYDLDNIDLHKEITSLYDFPFSIYNEANLAAIGEYTFSSESENLVSISIHSGIGAGIVKNGGLLLGENGIAGEVGHSIIFPGGKKCPCGNHGCIEQYASNSAIYNQVNKRKNINNANSDCIYQYYLQKDKEIMALLHANSELISIAINNIIMLYDPEIIILNSSIYRKIPEMIVFLEKQLNSRFAKKTNIYNTKLNDKAILYGAVAVCIQQFLSIKKLKLYL